MSRQVTYTCDITGKTMEGRDGKRVPRGMTKVPVFLHDHELGQLHVLKKEIKGIRDTSAQTKILVSGHYEHGIRNTENPSVCGVMLDYQGGFELHSRNELDGDLVRKLERAVKEI